MLEEQRVFQAKTIVIVEDDENNREAFAMIIASETPYQPYALETESQLLAKIEEITSCNPVLFIFDYRLRSLTGLELYDQLQTVETLRKIPTLIITADAHKEIEQEVVQRNLTLLRKPFELDELLETIKQLTKPGRRCVGRADNQDNISVHS
jgi:CheY-like chemotaxis protein